MLELQGVTRLYGGQPGALDVTFSCPAGARTVIVGPSGSGKTTLLRLIAGFETPDGGTIRLADRLLAGPGTTLPPHRRNIAYVPQEGALFPHMSVADNVGFAIPRHAADRHERIDELLERVGLPVAMRMHRPHQLSGGQQQRVALARALAQKPDLMLLDEPFSALDSGLRDAMRNMVGALLAESGITSVLVTHDQAEALAFADHLVVMRQGRIADAGPAQRLYARPADPDTAQFLGSAIILPAEIRDGMAITPLGAVPVRATGHFSARILIRPEQIILGASANGSGAAVPVVRIGHRTFCGSHWKAEIEFRPRDTRGPIKLRTSMSLPQKSELQPGDLVEFAIRGEAHVFGRAEGQPG